VSGHTSAESRARAQARARCGTRASGCSTSPRASKNHRAGQKTTVARCGFWVFKKGPSPTGVGWSGSRKESHVGSSWPIAPPSVRLRGSRAQALGQPAEERAPACGQRIAATAIATASPFIAVSAEYLENRRIGKSPASAFCE
jgi:hypothetical protein